MKAIDFGRIKKAVKAVAGIFKGADSYTKATHTEKAADPLLTMAKDRIRPKNKVRVRKLRHGRDSRGMGIVLKCGQKHHA